MILFSALLAIGGLVVTSLIEQFYCSLTNWLKTLPEKLKKATPGILIGCKTFVDGVRERIRNGMVEISRNYSKVGDEWHMVSAERVVGMNEVPAEIVEETATCDNGLLDVTEELEMYLEG